MGGASVPSDNCYITQLPEGTTDDAMRAMFGQLGTIVQCRVLAGGTGSCAALVRFGSVDEAAQVIEAVESCQGWVEGCEQPISIRFADPPKWQQQQQQKGAQPAWGKGKGGGVQWPATQDGNAGGKGKGSGDAGDNLYVANLPPDTNTEELTTIFSQYGTVTSVRIVFQDAKNAAAMVKYATAEEASAVVETLNGNLPEGFERCEEGLVVRFAGQPKWKQQQQQQPEAAAEACFSGCGGKGAGFSMKTVVKGFEAAKALPGSTEEALTLYISNLPADCEDNDLFKLFGQFGALKSVRVLLNPDGSCRGIGFANFLELSAAELAIQTLNGLAMQDGSPLTVKHKTPPTATTAPGGPSSWIAQQIDAAASQVAGPWMPQPAAKRMKFL